MALIDELVKKYFATDLETIFKAVGINSDKINQINRPALKEVTLAQWLLASDKASSELATNANNFARLQWRDEMEGFAERLKIGEVEFCKFQDIDAFIKGYWKFLTRSPYAGLEENTNTPENFLGFLKERDYTTDADYVKNVMSLLPEAQKLLASTGGVVIPSFPEQLQLIRAPKEVAVEQTFKIEGAAPQADIGKDLSVMIDDKFPGNGVPVGEDGKWQFSFVFKQAGDRKMSIATGHETLDITFKVVAPVQPSQSKVIKLTGSVGIGGVNNAKDVQAVKQRLHELGYNWVGDPNTTQRGRGLDNAICLFQSIIAGSRRITGDGRVDVGGMTHQWLQAANAPKWIAMPSSNPKIGFRNHERDQTNDEHDFGTDWLADAILAIAKDYQNTYRNTHPSAAPFAMNDISLPHGGDTPDHYGHETGLMCDVFLPKKDGSFGGVYWWSAEYDRNAARAQLQAIGRYKLVRLVCFNDEKLIKEGLCQWASGHDHHFHFEISPPVRA